jgi:hypothetical protein
MVVVVVVVVLTDHILMHTSYPVYSQLSMLALARRLSGESTESHSPVVTP